MFLINVPIAVLGFAAALPLVPDSKNPSAQRPDLVGSLLSIAGLGLLLYAIIEAPVHGWTSTPVLVTGIGGLAVLACFVLWERASAHPMLQPALLPRQAASRRRSSPSRWPCSASSARCSSSRSSSSSSSATRRCRPACACSPPPARSRWSLRSRARSSGVFGTRLTVAAGMLDRRGRPLADLRRRHLHHLRRYRPGHGADRRRRRARDPVGDRLGDGLRSPSSTPASAAAPTAPSSRPAAPSASRSSAACSPPATTTT